MDEVRDFAERLREASRNCTGYEPSFSLLLKLADEAADLLSMGDGPFEDAMLKAGADAVRAYTGMDEGEPRICDPSALAFDVWRAMVGAAH